MLPQMFANEPIVSLEDSQLCFLTLDGLLRTGHSQAFEVC